MILYWLSDMRSDANIDKFNLYSFTFLWYCQCLLCTPLCYKHTTDTNVTEPDISRRLSHARNIRQENFQL